MINVQERKYLLHWENYELCTGHCGSPPLRDQARQPASPLRRNWTSMCAITYKLRASPLITPKILPLNNPPNPLKPYIIPYITLLRSLDCSACASYPAGKPKHAKKQGLQGRGCWAEGLGFRAFEVKAPTTWMIRGT